MHIYQPRSQRAHRHPPTDINPQFWAVYIQYKGRPYVCPTLWSSDLMVVRPYDRLTLWLSDLMIVRYYLVTWNLMIVWPYDRLTLWSSDLMFVWTYDRLTLWSSDLMFVWTYDLTLCLSGETGELMIWPYVCPGNLMIVHVDDRLVDDCLLTLDMNSGRYRAVTFVWCMYFHPNPCSPFQAICSHWFWPWFNCTTIP